MQTGAQQCEYLCVPLTVATQRDLRRAHESHYVLQGDKGNSLQRLQSLLPHSQAHLLAVAPFNSSASASHSETSDYWGGLGRGVLPIENKES